MKEEREKSLANERKRRQRTKEKEVKRNLVIVRKTPAEVQLYNAKKKSYHELMVKMGTIERNILYVQHKFKCFVLFGLDTMRFNIDARFTVLNVPYLGVHPSSGRNEGCLWEWILCQ